MRIKLFENFKNEELLENVKDCFQDLIDDDIAEIADSEEFTEEFKSSVIISCIIPSDKSSSTSFDSFYNQKKNHFDIITEVKNCVDRLKQVHNNDVDVNFEYYSDSDENLQIDFYISEGIGKIGDFWKISNDGLVRLDYDKLIDVLKIPKVEFSRSFSGKIGGNDSYSLGVYFKNESELDKYSKKLIDDMLNLEVDGKKLVADHKWSYSTSTGDEISKYKIYREYNRHRSTGYYDTKKDIVNYIDFGLNPELKYA